MRILRSIVAPSATLVAFCDSKMTGCGGIRSQLIRDELVWDKAIFLQQLAHQSKRRPNSRAKMLFRTIDKPPPALLAKRMNEASRNGLGEYLVASIEALGGHDPRGELTGIQAAASERVLAQLKATYAGPS